MNLHARIGNRLRLARKMQGLSLQQLADAIGISKQMLSKYENGLQLPGSARLLSLAKALSQSIDFFTSQEKPSNATFSFRKRSKLKGKALEALELQVQMKIADYLFIEDVCGAYEPFVNPLANFQIHNTADVCAAAQQLRESWHIGVDALASVIDLLEDNGIKIIEVDETSGLFDGLATWVDSKHPMIVIAREMPVERKRFTLLHELGHLLLQISSADGNEQEQWCNAFSSEFLLPAATLSAAIGGKRQHISAEELIQLQSKFGISCKAILYKMGELNLLAQSRVKGFYVRLSQNASLKKHMEVERFMGAEKANRFEQLVYRALTESYISMSKGAYLLGKKLEEVRETMTLHLV